MRRVAPIPIVVAGLVLVTGCSGLVDTPLGAAGDQRVVAPGEDITGEVVHPDGEIRVTLADGDAPLPPNGQNSRGARACAYDDGRFVCSTEGLDTGAYRVEVTDATWQSEGTHVVEVVLTDVPDYDPRVSLADGGRALLLTGWEPGRTVTLTVKDVESARAVAGPLGGTPDARGSLTVGLGDVLPAGTYRVDASDGLWSSGTLDNGWAPVFLTID
ncbi:hypothetical protein [Nocardioides litoris]|uniref:hypothetical protein n=1 Tax=Nocardioides litoris TaxID=1926648 RepID=UPI001123690D|nr:hypothetical protein [Nocardioides litoris]